MNPGQIKRNRGFEEVLRELKEPRQAAVAQRPHWGDGVIIYRVPSSKFRPTRPPLDKLSGGCNNVSYCDHIDRMDAQLRCAPYTPSNDDLFAEDWIIKFPFMFKPKP